MDPNTTFLLNEIQKRVADELTKRFEESDAKWEKRFLKAENLHGECIEKLESFAQALEEWRPQVEAKVDYVKLEIGKLSRHWERSVRDGASTDLGIFPNPNSKSALERPSAPDPSADGPKGHSVDHHHRDMGFGSVFTHYRSQSRVRVHIPLPYRLSSPPAHMSLIMISLTWANYLSLISLPLNEKIQNSGYLDVRITLTCIG
jgi:hypothetical protein